MPRNEKTKSWGATFPPSQRTADEKFAPRGLGAVRSPCQGPIPSSGLTIFTSSFNYCSHTLDGSEI